MFSFVQKDLGCVCLCVFVLCIDMWYLGLIIKRFNHIIQVLHLFTQNLFYSGPWCSHVILSDILKAFLLSILIIVTLHSNLWRGWGVFLICLHLKLACSLLASLIIYPYIMVWLLLLLILSLTSHRNVNSKGQGFWLLCSGVYDRIGI